MFFPDGKHAGSLYKQIFLIRFNVKLEDVLSSHQIVFTPDLLVLFSRLTTLNKLNTTVTSWQQTLPLVSSQRKTLRFQSSLRMSQLCEHYIFLEIIVIREIQSLNYCKIVIFVNLHVLPKFYRTTLAFFEIFNSLFIFKLFSAKTPDLEIFVSRRTRRLRPLLDDFSPAKV